MLKLGVLDYLIKDELTPEILRKSILNVVEKTILKKQLKKQETDIQYRAHYDFLTGAPNRFQFNKLASQMVSRAKRHKKNMAIFMIDLDFFKKNK